MAEHSQYMVNHLTRVIMRLTDDPAPCGERGDGGAPTPAAVRRFGRRLADRAARVAAMMDALAERGFAFKLEKDSIFADSCEIEAQDAKKYLLSRGFADTEFQVLLEYTRKWEVL